MADFYDDPIDDDSIDDGDDVQNPDSNSDDGTTVTPDSITGDDGLTVNDDDMKSLEDKASKINRSDTDNSEPTFTSKMCPSRHGCQGATDCDYSYGSYPG